MDIPIDDWRLSLHSGDEITIDSGDNELPPSIIISEIEFYGDSRKCVKIVDREGNRYECFLHEIT